MGHLGNRLLNETRGRHCCNAYTMICDCGQNALTDLVKKILSLHWIGIMILGLSVKIFLDLDLFTQTSKRYSGLTINYGK